MITEELAKSELEIILRLRVIHEFQDTNSSGYEKARRSALPRTEVPYSGILHATRNDKNNPENNITFILFYRLLSGGHS